MSVKLYGYQHSVYSWIARLAMREKGVVFRWSEIDPFARPKSASYLCLHPFYRVPTLVHDKFVLYETGAIIRYVDEQFDGPPLQPSRPQLRAIQNQLISITDSYAYWPLVRQVFSHQFFRPRIGESIENSEIVNGLEAAKVVLRAINMIATYAEFLVSNEITLADIHLFPIISYFASAPDGIKQLQQNSCIMNWYERMAKREAVIETKPELLKFPIG